MEIKYQSKNLEELLKPFFEAYSLIGKGTVIVKESKFNKRFKHLKSIIIQPEKESKINQILEKDEKNLKNILIHRMAPDCITACVDKYHIIVNYQ